MKHNWDRNNFSIQRISIYRIYIDIINYVGIVSPGDKWKCRRKLLNASLNPNFLKNFLMPIFNNQSQRIKNKLSTEVEAGKYFDIWPYFIETSTDTISRKSKFYLSCA